MSGYNRRRHLGRFASGEEFEVAVVDVLAQAGVLRTSEVGEILGPITYNFAPRCGHDDCTRPDHQTPPAVIQYHPADIVRPVLQRLQSRGLVERVVEDGAPQNRGHLWRWVAPADRPCRRSAADAAVERVRVAQAQLERRLGVGA